MQAPKAQEQYLRERGGGEGRGKRGRVGKERGGGGEGMREGVRGEGMGEERG